jgi:hypothetical protein
MRSPDLLFKLFNLYRYAEGAPRSELERLPPPPRAKNVLARSASARLPPPTPSVEMTTRASGGSPKYARLNTAAPRPVADKKKRSKISLLPDLDIPDKWDETVGRNQLANRVTRSLYTYSLNSAFLLSCLH